MHWDYTHPQTETVSKLKQGLEISEALASLLAKQGWEDIEETRTFLHPRLSQLDDPFALTHLKHGVDRILKAMRAGERILVLGDYDVDGITSTTLLVSILRLFNTFPQYVLPKRLEEGYGLSQAVVDRSLAEAGKPDVLVALDCGTNSVQEVAFLREQGVDVIIIDHHRSKEGTPDDCILINPHIFDSPDSPWSQLCTVGLVFKFVHGLIKQLRTEGDATAESIRLRDYLDLVSMGTVADLVPMSAENRILTHYGLKSLRNSSRRGLKALFEVSGMNLGQTVKPMDISFRLGPRINACGRLGDAILPVELLLSDDRDFCRKTAQKLERFNRERQGIEREMCEEAEAKVNKTEGEVSGILVWDDNWHPGVVGIVAGKMARQYNRPAIVLGRNDENVLKGSGRSMLGINLTHILAQCDDLLLEWGGHPMAVGIAVERKNADAFQKRFTAAIEETLAKGEIEEPCLDIAHWLQPNELDEALLKQMDLLCPFGEGNPEPVFGVRNVVIEQQPKIFSGTHFRFHIPTGGGKRVAGIAWNKASNPLPLGEPIELAIKFGWNQWNGQTTPQAELIDWRPVQ